MTDPQQIPLCDPISAPKSSGGRRPPLPDGYREAKGWNELLEAGNLQEVYSHEDKREDRTLVRVFRVHVMAVRSAEAWAEVDRVCERPRKGGKSFDRYCVLKDGTVLPDADTRDCYCVREEDIEAN